MLLLTGGSLQYEVLLYSIFIQGSDFITFVNVSTKFGVTLKKNKVAIVLLILLSSIGSRTKTSIIAASIAIAVLVITVISFPSTPVIEKNATIYDKTIISKIEEIAKAVPKNETLVVSYDSPYFVYFTEHKVRTPWGITSAASLADHMKSSNLHYLVVFENKSSEIALKPLFNSKGLMKLTPHFQQLNTYSSDYSKLYLYKLES